MIVRPRSVGFLAGVVALAGFVLLPVSIGQAKTLHFSGYKWTVRPTERGGPGPNNWSPANAWVDGDGHLHLLLSQRDGRWYCPEVYTEQGFGLGRYEFVVQGPIDHLDKNVVLGLFDYPEADQGPDGTNEIDIEFSRWGKAGKPIGNYTVFPAVPGVDSTTTAFGFQLPGQLSTQVFTRTATEVSFESRAAQSGGRKLLGKWAFAPTNPAQAVPQLALPVHLNLWLFESPAPSDGKEVEIVIRSFRFVAE